MINVSKLCAFTYKKHKKKENDIALKLKQKYFEKKKESDHEMNL